MSIQTPPTLLQLAVESLLRDQASAISALEYLPAELFPPLFIQAYQSRIWEPLMAMLRTWPFTVLPLGDLMQLPSVMVLKAMLDELDVLLAQKVRPRRWKLRVLDFRNTGANFWRMWCGDSTQKCSLTGPVAVHISSPNMEHPLAPLEVFLDLNFNERDRDKFFMYIIQWAQQRKELVHLCCKTLRFFDVPFERARKVLDGVQLDCIQEVEVDYPWDLPTLGSFALYMGQMSNLQRLSLSHINLLAEEEEDWDRKQQEEQRYFSQFLSQMLRLRHLRDLNMESPSFLRGRLDQMLRCLQTPLDKLSIWLCWQLTHSDLTHLFQCPNLRQLKSLHLYGANLTDFSPEPFRALLEAVAPTLQDLRLDNCGMVDSQVEAILPVLSHCHRLRKFTISKNNFSMATVEKLLRHTAGLCSLEFELYPIPLECYRTQETVDQERVALIRAELKETLRELGKPRTIHLDTKYFSSRQFYLVVFS
ncbi:PRAME family member 12 [Myotis brandtii]|uniref:PRAME family member 12 n=1 Tax=Myotis brandtii TaxID=109478 RepID=S7N572_MYOBR|nr:PREDICTED: PRAME family member 12 [Myotis brandtii]EPQ12239.1 PRAME family member 12 [Myotis brandtii]